MKTIKLKAKIRFFDKQANESREKGTTFTVTDEQRAEQLLKSTFVELIGVIHVPETSFHYAGKAVEASRHIGEETPEEDIAIVPKKKRRRKVSETPLSESQPSQE